MLFPVSRLLEGRALPLCVKRSTTVREALAKMIANDFSQLPVIDEDGYLVGIISDESITRTYFHLRGKSHLLDLTVDNCESKPAKVEPDDDLFDALDKLQDNFAVVVVAGRRPVGILTDYDTTRFFRDVAGDLMVVEDIETTIRNSIAAALGTDARLNGALAAAFGPDKSDPTRPAKALDGLTFGDQLQVIRTEANWPSFAPLFTPKDVFLELMEGVRSIRNKLTHFRGSLDPTERDCLKRARQWIEPRALVPLPESSSAAVYDPTEMREIASSGKGKYERLGDWLRAQPSSLGQIDATYAELELVLGDSLPRSAHEHRSWWANDSASHSQSIAWLEAGWRVVRIDAEHEVVTFARISR